MRKSCTNWDQVFRRNGNEKSRAENTAADVDVVTSRITFIIINDHM